MNDTVKLSAALSRVFRRHFDGVYFLPHVDGIIRRYINKEESIAAIKRRYSLYFAKALTKYQRDPQRLKNTQEWRLRMHALVVDLKILSHADFDVLRQLKADESMQRPIMTIDGKSIELTKEE